MGDEFGTSWVFRPNGLSEDTWGIDQFRILTESDWALQFLLTLVIYGRINISTIIIKPTTGLT